VRVAMSMSALLWPMLSAAVQIQIGVPSGAGPGAGDIP
jgi:hypothetical protein